jgi:hypothetical protein
MLRTSQIQNIDLWEAWIEFDQLHPEFFGVLYITGEVATNKRSTQPFYISKEENSSISNTLVLRLNYEISEEGNYTEEVIYSEPLLNINPYTSVVIYAKDNIVAVIKDIEVLV